MTEVRVEFVAVDPKGQQTDRILSNRLSTDALSLIAAHGVVYQEKHRPAFLDYDPLRNCFVVTFHATTTQGDTNA